MVYLQSSTYSTTFPDGADNETVSVELATASVIVPSVIEIVGSISVSVI